MFSGSLVPNVMALIFQRFKKDGSWSKDQKMVGEAEISIKVKDAATKI